MRAKSVSFILEGSIILFYWVKNEMVSDTPGPPEEGTPRSADKHAHSSILHLRLDHSFDVVAVTKGFLLCFFKIKILFWLKKAKKQIQNRKDTSAKVPFFFCVVLRFFFKIT